MARRLTFLCVCSGISAATCAWHPLGMQCIGYAEISSFPKHFLKTKYPETPNYGDIRNFASWPNSLRPTVLVGGTPCPSFSIAGPKTGLDDPRGDLAFSFIGIAAKYRPRWVLWENVPHCLAVNGGSDFGAILERFTGRRIEIPEGGWKNSGIAEGCAAGYGVAWRVLDAQFAGVPQQRRRVFLVGFLGDWRRAAAVLFEREGLRGDPPPRRRARNPNPGPVAEGFGISGEPVARTLNAGAQGRQDFETETLVAQCLRTRVTDSGTLIPDVATTLRARSPSRGVDSDATTTLLAFTRERGDDGRGHARAPAMIENQSPTIEALHTPTILDGDFVRRLTPLECERCQGLPDGWTDIPMRLYNGARSIPPDRIKEHNGEQWIFAADSPRYKAIGNSIAVPVLRAIGERILAVDRIK